MYLYIYQNGMLYDSILIKFLLGPLLFLWDHQSETGFCRVHQSEIVPNTMPFLKSRSEFYCHEVFFGQARPLVVFLFIRVPIFISAEIKMGETVDAGPLANLYQATA